MAQQALAEYDEAAVYKDEGEPEDIGLANEDWLRGMSWDIWVHLPTERRLVATLPELRLALAQSFEAEHDGIAPASDELVNQFLGWPAAQAVPDGLRAELTKAGFTAPKKEERQ